MRIGSFKPGVRKLSVKGQIINILEFGSDKVSVVTIQLYFCSSKTP